MDILPVFNHYEPVAYVYICVPYCQRKRMNVNKQ